MKAQTAENLFSLIRTIYMFRSGIGIGYRIGGMWDADFICHARFVDIPAACSFSLQRTANSFCVGNGRKKCSL